LIRELGRGGQAVVYLAEDPRLSRQVAVKVLTGWGPSSEDALARFRREAEVASKLDHPGICTVHDMGVDHERAYIVMQFVDGESLRQRLTRIARERRDGSGDFFQSTEEASSSADTLIDAIRESPAEVVEPASASGEEVVEADEPLGAPAPWDDGDLRTLLRVFADAAHALHAAHEAGVIHRDVKPGNLIVDRGGRPVIVDFGLARDVDPEGRPLTQTGDLFGTPAYMSPEQLASHHIRLDRRTDVYSLGVTLYEVITLHRPFEAPTRQALYQAIMTKEPPNPRRYNRRIGRSLKVVIETALEKDRDCRYQTAEALAEDLQRVLDGAPVEARATGPVVRMRRWVYRNPVLAPTILGLFLVLALGLFTSLVLLDRARTERDAKEEALSEVERLSDLKKLRNLEATVDTLWPASVENVPSMDAWLARARALTSRLAGHRAVLDALRARGDGGWRMTAFEELVLGIGTLPALVERMKWRRNYALNERRTTVEERAASWARCRNEVERDYGGLMLDPIAGLVPLGQDPRSKLQIFAHAQSGAVPALDPEGIPVVDGGDAIILVLIPGGTVRIGHDTEADAAPVHGVSLDPYFIAMHEMTQGQWRRIRGDNPSYYRLGDAHPVENVSWSAARRALLDVGLDLPTEVQWEHACRALSSTDWYISDDVRELEGHANVADRETNDRFLAGFARTDSFSDGWADTHAPVGSFKANPFGLHDVHGNVWEWCRDDYASYANPARPNDGLRRVKSSGRKVARGGGFFAPASKAMSWKRMPLSPTFQNRGLGVRPVMQLRL